MLSMALTTANTATKHKKDKRENKQTSIDNIGGPVQFN